MNIPSTFQCLGKQYKCTTDSPADPDIVGIGIMAAFFATSIATFTTILVGYFKTYLPEVLLNDVDRLLLRIIPGRSKNSKEAAKINTRRRGVEAFILSLSDQQLATGLAILIAGFVKCDISVYSFRNVSAIAWFSCTTHLATLTILKRHLRKHRYVLPLRVVGMLLIAGLLVASNFMSTIANATVKAWRRETRLEEGLDVCFYCVLGSSDKTPGYFWMDLVSTLWLVWAYPVRLFALYAPERTPPRREKRSIDLHGLKGLREMPLDDHYNLIRRIHKSCDGKNSEFRKNLFSGVYFAWFAYLEMRRSYWWEIVWLLFAGAFSLSKVLVMWLSYSDISGSRVLAEASTEMGFGQIAALLLLLIPCLAALEAFKAGSESTRPVDNQAEEDGVQVIGGPDAGSDFKPDFKPNQDPGPEPGPQPKSKESFTDKVGNLGTGDDAIQVAQGKPGEVRKEEHAQPQPRADSPATIIRVRGTEVVSESEMARREVLLQPGNDPYEFHMYRYILGVLIIIYSIYIIGIGAAMAIAPNIQTFAYACVPFALEVCMKGWEVFLFSQHVYRGWRNNRAFWRDVEKSAQMRIRYSSPRRIVVAQSPQASRSSPRKAAPYSLSDFTTQRQQLAHY